MPSGTVSLLYNVRSTMETNKISRSARTININTCYVFACIYIIYYLCI